MSCFSWSLGRLRWAQPGITSIGGHVRLCGRLCGTSVGDDTEIEFVIDQERMRKECGESGSEAQVGSLEERRRQVHERERPEGSAPTGRPGPLERARCGYCGEFGIRRGLIGGHCTHCGSYGTFQSPAATSGGRVKGVGGRVGTDPYPTPFTLPPAPWSGRMWKAALGEEEL